MLNQLVEADTRVVLRYEVVYNGWKAQEGQGGGEARAPILLIYSTAQHITAQHSTSQHSTAVVYNLLAIFARTFL